MDTTAALSRLIDRDALEELARVYMRGLDRRDRDLLRSVFHDDATTHYGRFSGSPDEFVDYALGALSTHLVNHHLIGQINLWFGDDPSGAAPSSARGEVYFSAFHRMATDGASTDMVIAGRYVDRYERRDGRWGMSHRTEIVDWARTDPTLDDYMPNRPLLVRGTPGHDDLSYRIEQA
jgi:hypothetical protein